MKYNLLSFILFIIFVHNTHSIKNNDINKVSLIKENKENKNCNENCLLCNNLICKKCIRGFYIFRNKCLKICPENYYADNFSFECKHFSGKNIFKISILKFFKSF